MSSNNTMSVQGKFQRFIRLQTPLETAFAYFTDFAYVLPRLPEIGRVLRYRDGRYRLIFMSDDGRGHEMGIVFDIRHEIVENRHVKMIAIPVNQHELTGDRASQGTAPLFPGLLNGEVILTERHGQIEVVYRLDLFIEIEVPRFLSFIPKPMLQKIGESLMQFKLHAVGDGFAERLTEDFVEWNKRHVVRANEPIVVRRGLTPELN